MNPTIASITQAAEGIRSRIAATGVDPASVAIVAVTKTFPAEVAAAAFDAGFTLLGENYAAELVDKAHELADRPISWHYLGAIQTNKVARLAPVTSCFQGLSRVKEAVAIARHRPGAGVMVQVDLTGRPERGGVPPGEVEPLVIEAQAIGLDVQGLMTVAPDEPAAARSAFREVARIADGLGLKERSMGMTGDLEIAVEEGATMVRIGRALFGTRS
jgi:pyridoxal phosphate enzyme (YggS family)